jgi:hypothetical protein
VGFKMSEKLRGSGREVSVRFVGNIGNVVF